jgi:hypothetical protein
MTAVRYPKDTESVTVMATTAFSFNSFNFSMFHLAQECAIFSSLSMWPVTLLRGVS